MARTKGAKDNKPRKKAPPPNRQTSAKPAAKAVKPNDQQATPSPDEFVAAIDAELKNTSACPEAKGAAATAAGEHQDAGTPTPPSPDFDPATLTKAAWAAVWQVPFIALAWALKLSRQIHTIDPIVACGKRHAAELAEPSYLLWEHSARQYLGLDPTNGLHLAGAATALNGVATLPDLFEAIAEARKPPARPASTE